MFNIGTGEIILIAIIALIFIPPDKLPEVATKIGRMYHQFRTNFLDLKSGVEKTVKKETSKYLPTKDDFDFNPTAPDEIVSKNSNKELNKTQSIDSQTTNQETK